MSDSSTKEPSIEVIIKTLKDYVEKRKKGCGGYDYWYESSRGHVFFFDIILPWMIGMVFPFMCLSVINRCIPSPLYNTGTPFALYWSLMGTNLSFIVIIPLKNLYHCWKTKFCEVGLIRRHQYHQWPYALSYGASLSGYLCYVNSMNVFWFIGVFFALVCFVMFHFILMNEWHQRTCPEKDKHTEASTKASREFIKFLDLFLIINFFAIIVVAFLFRSNLSDSTFVSTRAIYCQGT